MSSIKQQIDKDLKTALLEGNKELVTTLRGLKSSLLYEEVAAGKREDGLDDAAVITVLQKEAKKRQDSADLYDKGGDVNRRDKELAEKTVIDKYLPDALSDEELNKLVEEAITKNSPVSLQSMGVIIGQVKQAAAGQADGSRIAQVVRERLASQ
jgi:hypothetical protein